MKVVNVVAGIIKKDNKYLVAQRGYGEFKGMYEFPGGKIEEGELPQVALKRELKEELDIEVEVNNLFHHVHYQYDSFILEMDCFWCELLSDQITLLEHLDYRWISGYEEGITWVPADIEVIERIMNNGL